MKAGEATLVCQKGGHGVFGRIRLQLEELDKSELIINYNEGVEFKYSWRYAVQEGAECALRFLRRGSKAKGLSIQVFDIDWHHEDTTEQVIKFITAKAIFNATGFMPEPELSIDKNGNFTFPEI